MTVGFVPAFDPKLTVSFEGDGASLFHHAAVLDELADELGVPALTRFTDEREPPPDFDGYPEELHEAIGPWTEWFAPEEGLRCVDALLVALDDTAVLARFPVPVDGVVADLEALRDVLAAGEKRRARFRLEVA